MAACAGPSTQVRRQGLICRVEVQLARIEDAMQRITRAQVEAGKVEISGIVTGKRMRPVPPGEILLEEFMKPVGLSANALALALRVPTTRIGAIIRKESPRSITADTAMRLGRYFGSSAEFWLNLQTHYDLEGARRQNGKAIERDVRRREAA